MSAITQTELTTPTSLQLHALLHTTGIARLDDTAWLRVTGEDRVRWLNGMVTNSINDLKPGEGCYNFILSAQGRIQGTVTAFALAESILLQTDRTQLPHLLTTLDRFIIMDDVELAELTDITEASTGLALIGPASAALLTSIGFSIPASGPQHKGFADLSLTTAELSIPTSEGLSLQTQPWQGHEVHLIAAHSPLVPRFELWADPSTIATLTEALTTAGATPCTPTALDQLRILEGTPRYGTDIRDKELPQETAQTRALHFAKGCYLGQEIVERIRSRGNVHRTFTGFRLEGTLPTPGSLLEADGKPIGELTSITTIFLDTDGTPIQIALGYIRREALDRGATITYTGGKASPQTLPFPLPAQNP